MQLVETVCEPSKHMPFLELLNAGKCFGAKHVLEHVNLSVEEGEFLSVVGYSGSGKSTLIGLAADCTLQPLGGSALQVSNCVDSPRTRRLSFRTIRFCRGSRRWRMFVSPSTPRFLPGRSRSNATSPGDTWKWWGLARQWRSGPANSPWNAAASSHRTSLRDGTRILFLDEPFGALDALTRANLQQELIKLCSVVAVPVTVLMITNNVEEAILLSDRIVPLSKGPRATLGPEMHVPLPKPRTASMLAHNEDAVRIQARIVEYLTGFAHRHERAEAAASMPIAFNANSGGGIMMRPLEITGLGRRFPTPTGPFHRRQKTSTAAITTRRIRNGPGPLGCGKSTVLAILAGLERATEGGFCNRRKRSRLSGR